MGSLRRRIGLVSRSCLLIFMVVCPLQKGAHGAPTDDPLPSWAEGPSKRSVLDFVRSVVEPGGPGFAPVDERIATFDNDGTLWVEQPLYTQVVFAHDRVKKMAPSHPGWKTEEPFRSILSDDPQAMARFTIQDFERVIAATHAGMTVDEFQAIVKDWLATTKHPRFDRLYTELIYQPMLELLSYLRANGFKTYIVTGGGQAFVRTFADSTYGVPPEQVIGSAGRTKYEYAKDGEPVLVKQPSVLLVDDKTGKPEDIDLVIGRRPIAAFGNSTGDQQMLEWAQAGRGARPRLMMLVHHDDAIREYDYGPDSRVGTFTDALMVEAQKRGWSVISMKNDWKRIFPFEK